VTRNLKLEGFIGTNLAFPGHATVTVSESLTICSTICFRRRAAGAVTHWQARNRARSAQLRHPGPAGPAGAQLGPRPAHEPGPSLNNAHATVRRGTSTTAHAGEPPRTPHRAPAKGVSVTVRARCHCDGGPGAAASSMSQRAGSS
jgi:hypothetical protein